MSTFVLRIVASEVLGIRSPFGSNFQVLAFLIGFYWLLTGTVSTRRNATGMSRCWRLRGLAVKLGANSLSLFVVSGCSAKASEASWLDLDGRDYCNIPIRFRRRHILFLLYAQPMFDVLTEARESPPRRVPEQLSHVGSTVAPRAHGNGQQGRTRNCQFGASAPTIPTLGGSTLTGRRGAERCKALMGRSYPSASTSHLPSNRRGGVYWGWTCELKPSGRILVARAPCWGVSPIRDPHALSRRCRSRCSSLGRMAFRMCSAQASLCRRAWARNKQGPFSPSCSGPRSHRTHQGCTSVPRLVFKYALRCRSPRQASPCRLWLSIRSHCFAALLTLFVLDLCHTQTLLSA